MKKNQPKGKEHFFKSFVRKLRKRRIIETLAAFIGGGWLVLEFVHWILIDHYHLPEKILDIAFVTILTVMISTLIWRWFRRVEKKSRKVKVEFILIPLVIFTGLVLDAVFITQKKSTEQGIAFRPEWKNSIAVLPFQDLSIKRDQAYFCEGITDAIITRLSTIKELKVISRTSAIRYKDTDKDIKQIGQELNVATILEGSIQKEEDNIRITAQLISVEDGFYLWANIYDQKLESIF